MFAYGLWWSGPYAYLRSWSNCFDFFIVVMGCVFVVEDELLHAEHTKMSVEEAGFTVAGECDNADQALEAILKAKPDVVLMDISLPGKNNGISVAKALKEKSQIPVIFTSSLNDEETLREAAETAPISYLVKPVEVNNLKAAITICPGRFE